MRKTSRGFLIALEGIDGAGKTTQARLLVRWLRRNGVKAVYTSEPTNSEIGTLLKQHLSGRRRYTEEIAALLFAADRLYHVDKVIAPALRRRYVVVSDRYVHSSIAYQTAATGKREWIKQINSLVPKPDLSILIDLPPSQAIERIKQRRKYLYEQLRFLESVRQEYIRLVKRREMIRIDGSGDRQEVHKAVVEAVLSLLKG